MLTLSQYCCITIFTLVTLNKKYEVPADLLNSASMVNSASVSHNTFTERSLSDSLKCLVLEPDLSALARALCCRCRNYDGEFILEGGGGKGGRGWREWWGGRWGKWCWSGWPRVADSYMWRLSSSHDNCSLSLAPWFQCLASCKKLETATSRLKMVVILIICFHVTHIIALPAIWWWVRLAST